MKHWQFIKEKLEQKRTVYLMIVIHHKGSSPGRQGFKMVVADDNEIYGSIGGGVMEYNLVELCKEHLKGSKPKSFVKRQIHKGTIVDGSGMICSGEQTVIFYPLNESHLRTIDEILTIYANNKNGVLVISPSKFLFSADKKLESRYNYTHLDEKDWSFSELLNLKNVAYIVGGGHVALATTELLHQLGFYVVLFDNRSHLNTFEENKFVDEKQIIDYNDIADHIPENKMNFVAIMTNKYTDDKLSLSKIVRNNYKYIGVLGSKAKLELMFEVLQKEGYTKQELSRVHAPIGLNISSQTPEEIAVSIAAQMVAIKNN